MSKTIEQSAAGSNQHDTVDNSLVEQLWHDLDREVSHEQIRRVIEEIAVCYQDAPVQTFVPILIHR